MERFVHAAGLRERQAHRDVGVSGGTEYRYECRHCGADHGRSRRRDCPECDQTPATEWSSTMVEVLDAPKAGDGRLA